MTTTFTVPGNPFGKQRPRFNAKMKRTFTPKETTSYEERVRSAYLRTLAPGGNVSVSDLRPTVRPVRLDIIAYVPIAASVSKRARAAMLGAPCLKTPDYDNIGKIIGDALNGIAWADDKQVYDGRVRKFWSETGGVEVTIEVEDLE